MNRDDTIVTPELDAHNIVKARKVSQLSNCSRTAVGVVVARGSKVMAQAANGTQPGVRSCTDGGCSRCRSETARGQNYESCLCIHAEQAAVARAARRGRALDGAAMYSTLRPCLTCAKIALEAGIVRIVYADHIQFPPDVEAAYVQFIQESGLAVDRCESSLQA